MKTTFERIWSGEKRSWYIGIDLLHWALPLDIAFYGKTQRLVAFLCFYISIEWD